MGKVSRSVSRQAKNSIQELSSKVESNFPGYFNEEEREALSIHALHSVLNGISHENDVTKSADERELAIDSIYLDATELVVESNPEFKEAIHLTKR